MIQPLDQQNDQVFFMNNTIIGEGEKLMMVTLIIIYPQSKEKNANESCFPQWYETTILRLCFVNYGAWENEEIG